MKKMYIPLIIFLVTFGLGMFGSIVYFRSGDDFYLLQIGEKYKNDIFTLVFKTYSEGYRPITWLVEVLEYKLFKLNVVGYQAFISIIFAIAMIYLYKLSKLLNGLTTGFIAFLCFIFYYPSLSTVWLKSNIGFALYLTFFGMALVYSIEALNEGKIKYFILASISSFFALLNYEFALAIIPILIMYVLLYREGIKNKLKAFIFLSMLFSLIIIVFLISQNYAEKSIILDRVRISFWQMLYNLDYWLRNSVNWYSYYLLLLAGIGLCRKLYSRIAMLLYGSMIYLIFKESSYIIYIFTIFIARFIFGTNDERFAIAMAMVGMLFVSTLAIPGYLIGMIRYPLFFWYGISIFIALGLTRLVKQLANNFEHNIKYKIAFQYIIVVPLFILGAVQTIKNDFIIGRDELYFLRDKTNANKKAAFYLKKTVTTYNRVMPLWEEFGYNFIFNYYCPNQDKILDVPQISWDSFWEDIDKAYIVAETTRITKLFPEICNKDTDLDGVFSVYFGRDVKGNAVLLQNKGLRIKKYDENAVFYETVGNNPVSSTYLINSDKPQMWITIITYPRMVYPYREDSFCKVLYSLNGENWMPVTYFGGKGLFGYWTPICGNEIRQTFFIPNSKVYIKVILQNGQLWSSLVWPSCIIINNKPAALFKDMLIKNTAIKVRRTSRKGEDIVFLVKVVKEFHKDLYGISILNISRLK